MPNLYPELQPYHTELIDVGDGHQIYLELNGNPKGIPVLFVHGGPGAGLSPNYRRFFDPQDYFIVGFEQRGCGRSTPFADLTSNTTSHLIEDIEQIRQHLGISTWLLFGGSWGSTLALLYAMRFPHTVKGFILRGTFLARQEDVDWFLKPDGGAANLFPEYYRKFSQFTDNATSSQAICDAYYTIFSEADELTQAHALSAWFGWEERLSRLVLPYANSLSQQHFHFIKSLALLECHYLKHQCFIDDNYILENIAQICHLPATIIHGRYDMICKAEAAHTLHLAWPNSVLQIVPDAGHSTSEKGIIEALVKATRQFANFIKRGDI